MTRLLTVCLLLAGCGVDETIARFATDGTYTLQTLDGSEVSSTITISFGPSGKVTGTAPCNSYTAHQTAPYPWFDIGPIAATKMACAALSEETAYFAALSKMTIAEVSGPILILTNEEGREMVFQAP